jgi:hypothetical protein
VRSQFFPQVEGIIEAVGTSNAIRNEFAGMSRAFISGSPFETVQQRQQSMESLKSESVPSTTENPERDVR